MLPTRVTGYVSFTASGLTLKLNTASASGLSGGLAVSVSSSVRNQERVGRDVADEGHWIRVVHRVGFDFEAKHSISQWVVRRIGGVRIELGKESRTSWSRCCRRGSLDTCRSPRRV